MTMTYKHTANGPQRWPSMPAMRRHFDKVDLAWASKDRLECAQCGSDRQAGRRYCEPCRAKKRRASLNRALRTWRKKNKTVPQG